MADKDEALTKIKELSSRILAAQVTLIDKFHPILSDIKHENTMPHISIANHNVANACTAINGATKMLALIAKGEGPAEYRRLKEYVMDLASEEEFLNPGRYYNALVAEITRIQNDVFPHYVAIKKALDADPKKYPPDRTQELHEMLSGVIDRDIPALVAGANDIKAALGIGSGEGRAMGGESKK